jgi:hypothetical protein
MIGSGGTRHPAVSQEGTGPMRFLDNWWEHLPTVLRFCRLAAFVVGIVAAAHGAPIAQHSSPQDHYWE